MVAVLQGSTDINTGYQILLLQKGYKEIRRQNIHNTQAALEEAMSAAPTLEYHKLRRGTNTGAWITVLPYTVNGTDLGDQEWRFALFL